LLNKLGSGNIVQNRKEEEEEKKGKERKRKKRKEEKKEKKKEKKRKRKRGPTNKVRHPVGVACVFVQQLSRQTQPTEL
jgi:hypothetical protein